MKDSEKDAYTQFVEGLQWYLPFLFKGIVLWFVEIVRFFFYFLWPKKDLRGKLLLLTGAGGGIGRASAVEFAKTGVRYILWDIDPEKNEETAEILRAHGNEVVAVMTVDVSDPKDIKRAGQEVRENYGIPDIVFNNAGILGGFNLFECDVEKYDRTMRVNTRSALLVNDEFLKPMIERDSGHFIAMASMAGEQACAGLLAYSMSKYALKGYMECLRGELNVRGINIQCTTVCPYYVRTEMARGAEYKGFLLPMLEPEYLAKKIVEAVQYNQEMLWIPRYGWFSVCFKGIMPTRVNDVFEEAFEVHTRASPQAKFFKQNGLKQEQPAFLSNRL